MNNRRNAVLAAATVVGLAACAGNRAPPAAVAPPVTAIALDASYDWHVLVTTPFGTFLKDLPFGVHEVLLFQDASHKSPQADDAECYAADAGVPRFLGRTPEEYLLCFKHDRLSRVTATVRLPQAEAAADFANACGLWMKTATSPAVPPGGESCAGADGPVGFNASLEWESDPQESKTALLSVTLNAAEPE